MLVKSTKVLPATIKSMNLMKKYPHIIELYACTRKVLAFNVFIPNKLFNFFRNMLKTKTIEINYFTSVTK